MSAMKHPLPQKRCLRCGKPTARRRSGRPTCRTRWIVLADFDAGKQMRKMGKLKGAHGRT